MAAAALQNADASYGCGYRNIQVALSFLLSQGPVIARRVFGGAGVPSVRTLQRAIEVSWRAGFDVKGAEQLVRACAFRGALPPRGQLHLVRVDFCE